MNALAPVVMVGLATICSLAVDPVPEKTSTETPDQAKQRHELVAKRRQQAVVVICHRGAHEFAHENTLEAYRATLELGGDGNEFDIRATKDGVLVLLHDDMLDRLLEAYGTVNEYTWDQLQSFRFRDPGPFGKDCRIPTLRELLLLHRRYGGLLHLDIKEPGLDRAIAALLDELDMWDHVAFCNEDNAGILRGHPKIKLLRYKAPGLFENRSEVDPDTIAAALKKPGQGLITDDPRGVLVALGRKLGSLSTEPVAPLAKIPARAMRELPTEAELLVTLKDADDWNRIAETPEDQAKSGRRIRARALAAEAAVARKLDSPAVRAALVERVRNRSLHKHWMYHGFDGAMAMRSLVLLHAPEAVETARFVLWRDDPALQKAHNPEYKTPVSWTDFRVQMVIFPALAKHPGAETEKLCRDYLAQTDAEARKFGPPQFEEAAKTLLTIRPETAVALELLKHRRADVRGRTILICANRAGEKWARQALEQGAPFALAYVVPERRAN